MDAAVVAPPRAIDLATETPFQVGRAAVDPASRDAAFDGGSERLQPQNLKVLIALSRQRGTVVTRDELIATCWDGRIIGDDVINRAISTLRQFAERAGGFAIETVPRAGYRLVETGGRARRGWRRFVAVGGAAIAAGAIAAGAIALWALFPDRTQQQEGKLTLTAAVLPFTANSADPTARELAAAARDSVAHMLSQSRFAVQLSSSASQSRGTPPDLLISGEFSEGPDRVLATVRMEDKAHRVVLFSRRFHAARDHAADLPDQIGAQVAGSLGWAVPLLVVDRRHPSDPAIVATLFRETALDDVNTLGGYDAARSLAIKAPNSAIAQIAFAFAAGFSLSDLPADQRAGAVAAARAALDRAQRLAPEFSLGGTWCLLHSPVRMIECEDRLRTEISANRDEPFTRHFLSVLLNDVGRDDESLEMARRSLAEDQYEPGKIALLLRMLEATGNIREAASLYRQSERWWPRSPDLFWPRVTGITERGDFPALERFVQEVGPAGLPAGLPEGYRPMPDLMAAMKAHSPAGARKACTRVPTTDTVAVTGCILVLARLRDLDGAFAFAGRFYPRRVGRTAAEEQVLWLKEPWATPTFALTSSAAAPLRRDPRFLALSERVGLLAYWRSGRAPDFCTKAHEPVCRAIYPRRT